MADMPLGFRHRADTAVSRVVLEKLPALRKVLVVLNAAAASKLQVNVSLDRHLHFESQSATEQAVAAAIPRRRRVPSHELSGCADAFTCLYMYWVRRDRTAIGGGWTGLI
jgi:tRNA G18 (ribose-2'-O)-methylase SpoU